MKIAIISDTHDNEANLQRALKIIKEENINTILHCGDISTMSFLKENFKDFNVYVALGNMDVGGFEDTSNIKIFKDFGEIENIAFCHHPELAEGLAESGKYEFVFHGHTHKPWEKRIKNCIIANPGNIAGLIFRPSFAILNKNKLELKIL